MTNDIKPVVGIIMGSRSDWETMQSAADTLQHFQVPYECRVVSAHRGEEIAEEVIDGPQSAIVQQAGNRMHGQKGLLVWLAVQSGWVEPNAI